MNRDVAGNAPARLALLDLAKNFVISFHKIELSSLVRRIVLPTRVATLYLTGSRQ